MRVAESGQRHSPRPHSPPRDSHRDWRRNSQQPRCGGAAPSLVATVAAALSGVCRSASGWGEPRVDDSLEPPRRGRHGRVRGAATCGCRGRGVDGGGGRAPPRAPRTPLQLPVSPAPSPAAVAPSPAPPGSQRTGDAGGNGRPASRRAYPTGVRRPCRRQRTTAWPRGAVTGDGSSAVAACRACAGDWRARSYPVRLSRRARASWDNGKRRVTAFG